MYRLFIDIPLPFTQEDSLEISNKILQLIQSQHELLNSLNVNQINYRLGHDEDRQNRNYFVIDQAGHASTKKSKIVLDKTETDAII